MSAGLRPSSTTPDMKQTVSFSFKRNPTDTGLALFAGNVLARIKDNPSFALLRSSLLQDALAQSLERYRTALQEAADGIRAKVAAKRVQRDRLLEVLDLVAQHISLIAAGDATLILEAGFTVRRYKSNSIKALAQVQDVRIHQSGALADVLVRYCRVPDAWLYLVEWSDDEGQHWQRGGHSSTLCCVVRGLPPRRMLLFRVLALGPKQMSGAPSAPVRFYVS